MAYQLDNFIPKGRGTIADLSAAATFTSPPADASIAVIQVFTQNVRMRDDGTAPTSSTGLQLVPGNTYRYAGNIDTVQFIEEAASATLEVAYYRAIDEAFLIGNG